MKKQKVTAKEQCDEYYNFYASIGLTPYECKRCTIHLINQLIELHSSISIMWGYKVEKAYLNDIKFHATQL
jgi:hypothetical protein